MLTQTALLLSTNHEMIPARNAVDAHAQDFVRDRRVAYYPPWQHSDSALAHYTPLEMYVYKSTSLLPTAAQSAVPYTRPD